MNTRKDETDTGDGNNFAERQKYQNVLHKRAVAQAVLKLKLIRNNDAVILDAGSSVSFLAGEIFSGHQDPPLRDLSILTHNLPVFMGEQGKTSVQERQYEMLITGGCYDKTYDALYGKITESSYETFHPTVVVLAISGLVAGRATEPGGVFCHAAVETSIKELLFRKRTDRRIIVADCTKVARMDSHRFGELSELLTGARRVCVVTTRPDPTQEDLIGAYGETMDQLRAVATLLVYEVEIDPKAERVIRVRKNEGTRKHDEEPGWRQCLDGWPIDPGISLAPGSSSKHQAVLGGARRRRGA
jgi:DeoR/GlpR family transcriptional regulator of sugar metabolism